MDQTIKKNQLNGLNGNGYVELTHREAGKNQFFEFPERWCVIQVYKAKRKYFGSRYYNNEKQALKAYEKALKNITEKIA